MTEVAVTFILIATFIDNFFTHLNAEKLSQKTGCDRWTYEGNPLIKIIMKIFSKNILLSFIYVALFQYSLLYLFLKLTQHSQIVLGIILGAMAVVIFQHIEIARAYNKTSEAKWKALKHYYSIKP